jgi:hypothetical protein
MEVRETYIEIMDFLAACGGAYAQHDTQTCRDVIDAILDDRYRVTRDSSGAILTVSTWWMIRPEDMDLVKNGGHPADISGGTIVYVADHAGKGGYPDLIRFLRTLASEACWHHRYKQPGQFRHYPKKEGPNA